MGFLDELAGALDGNQSEGHPPGQLQAVWHWVQEQGGIEVLLQKFQQGGLGEVFGSGSAPVITIRLATVRFSLLLVRMNCSHWLTNSAPM